MFRATAISHPYRLTKFGGNSSSTYHMKQKDVIRFLYFANSPPPSLTFRLREIEHQRVQTGMSFDDPDQEGTGPNGDSSDEGGEDRKWISPEQVKIKCIQGKRKERCLFDLIKSNHF